MRKDLPIIGTMAAFVDSMSVVVFSLYMLFVSRNGVLFMVYVNYMGLTASILLAFISAESPRWLI